MYTSYSCHMHKLASNATGMMSESGAAHSQIALVAL